MNQDYQLSTHSQANGDFWTQNGSSILANAGIGNSGYGAGSPAGTSPSKHSPMKKAHRLLRGRYPIAILLAAVGATIGGVAGYVAMPPKYESTGLVAINPLINNQNGESVIPMVTMYIQGQVGLISSARVADVARQDPKFVQAWQSCYGTAPVPAVADIVSALTVEHKGQTPLITVAFADRRKEVAEAGAHAILNAYYQLHGSGDEFDASGKTIEFNKQDMQKWVDKLGYENSQLAELGKKYHTTDLTISLGTVLANLNKYQDARSQAQMDLDRAIAIRDGTDVNKINADPEYVYEQIAGVDHTMSLYMAQRDTAASNLHDIVSRGIGEKNPMYLGAKQALADAQDKVEHYSKEYLVRNEGRIPFQLSEIAPNGNIEVLKRHIVDLDKVIAEESAKATEEGAVAQDIANLREEMKLTDANRQRDERTIADLVAKQTLTQSVVVESFGEEAVLASDKRKLVAGLGFGFGGLIPLSLILLYGMTENRFRFSDDASSADLAGTTLLGILPNLPDRLSDPQQAGIAAHCVHQIRTMLQISRSNDEPQVIAITSAASGDGKTSLTLALGLSYAACGARTLLIDCDLIAAGLTHRLNVTSTDGILEAVANRALLEYVRTTDIADVAVLPVGTTHAHHASTLSPVALRRLLSEAKKHFDLIIVDTGPILGSIEASLVCAAADRTILAVARNQQRPLVEKSIAHLQAIGAQLAGVVFNRAQARDFERSMSGLALRSRPLPGSMNATPSQSTAAKAVAGSFKRAG